MFVCQFCFVLVCFECLKNIRRIFKQISARYSWKSPGNANVCSAPDENGCIFQVYQDEPNRVGFR